LNLSSDSAHEAELLAEGYDAPALQQAAALTSKDDSRDVRDAIRRALDQLASGCRTTRQYKPEQASPRLVIFWLPDID
jgi:hypothetical protein